MRVLISAFACDPTRGSERGIGWAWAVAAARHHEVTLITGDWNRAQIERYLTGTSIAEVVYVATPPGGWRHALPIAGEYLSYISWQRAAARMVLAMHERVPFDLLHHITYGSCWLPSFLYTVVDAPTVFGPAGGAERIPASLMAGLPALGVLRELLRDVVRTGARFTPALRSTVRTASLCIAKTVESAEYLDRVGARRLVVASELSLPALAEDGGEEDCAWTGGPPRFVCVGRLQYFKGVHLSIRAFREVLDLYPDARLDIIGSGPDLGRLERLCSRLGVADSVEFVGSISRDEVVRRMRASTALVHPTLHDSSGNVLVEALSCGLPAVCLDIGGSRAVLPAGTGVLITPVGQRETVTALAEGMVRLARVGPARNEMVRRCRERALALYGLNALEQRIEALYGMALTSGAAESGVRG